eukprot:6237597-Pyramimonas_sp.AAC.1
MHACSTGLRGPLGPPPPPPPRPPPSPGPPGGSPGGSGPPSHRIGAPRAPRHWALHSGRHRCLH